MATPSKSTAATPSNRQQMSYPQQLKQQQQQASAPRAEEVHDSFYTHLLYEMLDYLIRKSDASADSSAQPATDDRGNPVDASASLKAEVELLGAELGKRACD